MYFNHRILQEAARSNVPLLERINFLSIYSNNLDEFFRVRMASLSRIAECGVPSLRDEQQKAKKLVKEISALNKQYVKEYEAVTIEVMEALREQGICIVSEEEIDDEQKKFVTAYYHKAIAGFVSPIWLSMVHQLQDEPDDSIFMALQLKSEAKKKPDYAIVKLPVADCGRFVRLPDKDGRSYIMYIDDVIRCCLPSVFRGMGFDSFEAYAFKFTKDAEMEMDNDLRTGILQKISKGVKSRKKGDALRIIYDKQMPGGLLKKLISKLNVDELDTVLAGGRYHNHRDLMSLPDCGREDLKYPRWEPIMKTELLAEDSMIKAIQQKDRFIHVPYHSFDHYIRLLQEAAINKNVKTIHTTLYRLAKNSKVVKALMCAAQNGKSVTVVIELLARFDESSNIDWSKKMQDAGINVIFGVEGLKIHSKITHIGLKNGKDIACISTGNFHEGNAKVYTDYMLMTSARPIVSDVAEVFSFIQKPYMPARFKELLLSPNEMQRKFMKLINDEIHNSKAGKRAYIKIKINHITDEVMVAKLYEASKAGVKIDLLVRGNCSIVPGVEGLSENISIRGIIDKYLEHSRIFIFAADGRNKTFIGSADWMPRNLYNRIEVVAPVYDEDIKKDLWDVVDFGLRDTAQGRVVTGSSDNPLALKPGEVPFRSQEELYLHYKKCNEQAPELPPADKQ